MAGNTVTLTFAGDALRLKLAAKEAKQSLDDVGRAAHDLDESFGKAGDGIDEKSGRIRKKLSSFGDGLVETLEKASARLPGVLSGAVGSLPPMGQGIALALVGGLASALAPMIGAAISSAVLLAAGGGVLAGGIALVAKNPKVKSAFSKLGDSLFDKDTSDIEKKISAAQARFEKARFFGQADGMKSAKYDIDKAKKELAGATTFNKNNKSLRDLAEPFVAPLTRAGKTLTDEFNKMKPAIERLFKTMAPMIDKLTPALGKFFENVMPGIEKAVTGSVPLFDVLAEHLPEIGTALGDFFTMISEHGDETTTFFGDMLAVVEWTITAVGEAISWLTSQYIFVRNVLLWIKDAASAVGVWFRDVLWGKWIKGAWDAILNKAVSVQTWLRGMPGRLRAAFAVVALAISAPFRAAFNRISDAWNNTVGRLSWTVPSWVPDLGGNSIGAPQLPKFHSGGVVPGAAGSEMLAILQAGETVTPAGGSGEMVHVTVRLDSDVLIEALTRGVRRRGGNVQLVLGGRNA
jgi:hypothetical protein